MAKRRRAEISGGEEAKPRKRPKRPRSGNQPKTIEMQERKPIELDDYFMGIAFLSGLRSKDPQTQVGACLVKRSRDDVNPRIVGVGYNGMPNGCNDMQLPWNRANRGVSKDDLNMKYLYVCHAEMNAIVNKFESDLQGSTIYVSMHPCNNCAKIIIQSGIKKVIYASDKNKGKEEFEAATKLFKMAGVETKKYKPSEQYMVLDFDSIDLCEHQKDKKKVVTLREPDKPVDRKPNCELCAKANPVAGSSR